MHLLLSGWINLFSVCPDKILNTIQLIQNAAVCVLTTTTIRDHIASILASLHWLQVKSRIKLENLVLTRGK